MPYGWESHRDWDELPPGRMIGHMSSDADGRESDAAGLDAAGSAAAAEELSGFKVERDRTYPIPCLPPDL